MANETDIIESLNDGGDDPIIEPDNIPEDISGLDAVALKAKIDEKDAKIADISTKNRKLFERAKKAEGFVLKDGHWIKEKEEPKPNEKVEPKATTGELDETQLDYLDLKGISDIDEIKVIQKVMQRTGQTVREALKDDYVVSKLKELRDKRDVANATPSATKRGGTQSDGFDLALAKFEKTGELPDDFELRRKVVNAKYEKESSNKPSWH